MYLLKAGKTEVENSCLMVDFLNLTLITIIMTSCCIQHGGQTESEQFDFPVFLSNNYINY